MSTFTQSIALISLSFLRRCIQVAEERVRDGDEDGGGGDGSGDEDEDVENCKT